MSKDFTHSTVVGKELRMLLTTKSFESKYGESPSVGSCALFGLLVIGLLFSIEHFLRYLLEIKKDWHVLLENETNRQILARHMGVDTLSCIICAIFGYSTRHICADILKLFYYNSSNHKGVEKFYDDDKKKFLVNPADFGDRLFRYHPGAFRTSLFFFWYQIKNTYDTVIWGDGPEFIFHHIFSLLTAYGTMVAGCGHVYAVFFFGMSEISTAVLCIVANFDDKHGVPGLGEAFPTAKVVLGAIFTILFIIFRCILWPVFGYHCARDLLVALNGTDPRVHGRRGWLTFSLIALVGISILQVAWLGQIFIIGKKELKSAGFL